MWFNLMFSNYYNFELVSFELASFELASFELLFQLPESFQVKAIFN